jgi:hypothetical protein
MDVSTASLTCPEVIDGQAEGADGEAPGQGGAVAHEPHSEGDPRTHSSGQFDPDLDESMASTQSGGSGGRGHLKRQRMTADERLIRSRERNRHHAKMTRMRKKQKMELLQVSLVGGKEIGRWILLSLAGGSRRQERLLRAVVGGAWPKGS